MSDRPITVAPRVDFTTSGSPLRSMLAQRMQLLAVAEDIEGAMRDVSRYGAEGAQQASYAAAWAATLMVADILRHGLAAADRRAAFLFSRLDRQVECANKVLVALGAGRIATRPDVLRDVDPNLQGTVGLLHDVHWVRSFLKDLGAKEPREIGLVLNIGISMAEDAVLMIQAGQAAQSAQTHASLAHARMRQTLSRIRGQLRLIDEQLARMIEKAQVISRTA